MKVIIVGNAGSLLDKENGHLIDEFDVVIRFNACVILGYEKYCGTKTDILCVYDNCILNSIINKEDQQKNETYIETVDTVWYSKKKNYVERLVTNDSISSKSNIVNFEYIDVFAQDNKESPFYYGSRPRTVHSSAGVLALSHALLTFPDASIYITGFDGFSTRHYWFSKSAKKPNFRPFNYHDPVREKKIISNLLNDGLITEL